MKHDHNTLTRKLNNSPNSGETWNFLTACFQQERSASQFSWEHTTGLLSLLYPTPFSVSRPDFADGRKSWEMLIARSRANGNWNQRKEMKTRILSSRTLLFIRQPIFQLSLVFSLGVYRLPVCPCAASSYFRRATATNMTRWADRCCFIQSNRWSTYIRMQAETSKVQHSVTWPHKFSFIYSFLIKVLYQLRETLKCLVENSYQDVYLEEFGIWV